jgi:hypothetical protein
METKYGFCQCGCGSKTNIATTSWKRYGWIKGKSMRFIHGHNSKGSLNGQWKGGTTISNGYLMRQSPRHPRNHLGYVFDHILKAEKALGKPLPKYAEIHHFPNLKNFTNLVICQNRAYHFLIELRQRALKECGHTHWRKCRHCKKWDNPKNLDSQYRHLSCHATYERNRLASR